MGLYRQGKRWWLDQIMSNGTRVHRSLKTTDKRLAEARATEIRDEFDTRERNKRMGLPDDSQYAKAAGLTFKAIVEEYVAELTRLKRSDLHVAITGARLRRIAEGVARLGDIAFPEDVRAALVRVSTTKAPGFKERGEPRKTIAVTGRTQNYYRLALSALFNWLVKEGRWPKNPVKAVARVAESEPKRPRRALTAAEVQAILGALEARKGMREARRRRRALYLLAFVSGLRRGELGALLWRDVNLDEGTLTSRPSTSKNRKWKVHALPLTTVETLAEIKPKDSKPEDVVFPTLPRIKTFYADLKAAGVERETPEGWIDFHGFARTTRATALAGGGVPLTTTQKMMRHSSPGITSSVYVRLGLTEERAAATKLEDFAGAKLKPEDPQPNPDQGAAGHHGGNPGN